MRARITSGSPFEAPIGFSRAVRIGPMIAVSGTVALDPDGKTVGVGDVYAQATRCLEIIAKAIADAGATLDDVIRTRVFLTDLARWREAGRAHGELFGEIRPACSFIGIAGLLDPDWLVEIEADCYVAS